MDAPLLLDPEIRDWVLLPLFLIILCASLLRHQTSILLRNSKTINANEAHAKSLIMSSQRLRQNHKSISFAAFAKRKEYLAASGSGKLREKIEGASTSAPNPMSDPSAMMGPMMGNMAFMVQNMVMMQGVGHFFSGFILVKVPIPLAKGFKQMFQRGLMLNTLDTSYVSSVSWYFLVMYGLRGLLRLIIGDQPKSDRDDMALQVSLGTAMGGGGQFDATKAMKGEGDSLEMSRYTGSLTAEAERKLVKGRIEKLHRAPTKNAGDDIFD